MMKLSIWETNEQKDAGWATLWLDGYRIDIALKGGRFSWDGSQVSYLESAIGCNPASLADKLDEIAATFKDAAKMERARAKKEAANV